MFLYDPKIFTESLVMHDFTLTQETDRITDFRIFYEPENVIVSRTGFFVLGRPCKYNIYKNIEGKADIPPFQCINSDVQK